MIPSTEELDKFTIANDPAPTHRQVLECISSCGTCTRRRKSTDVEEVVSKLKNVSLGRTMAVEDSHRDQQIIGRKVRIFKGKFSGHVGIVEKYLDDIDRFGIIFDDGSRAAITRVRFEVVDVVGGTVELSKQNLSIE